MADRKECAMDEDDEIEFSTQWSDENGNDISRNPFPESDAYSVRLWDHDFVVAEFVRRTDSFTWWELSHTDATGMTDDDRAELSGYRDAQSAVDAAENWYRANVEDAS